MSEEAPETELVPAHNPISSPISEKSPENEPLPKLQPIREVLAAIRDGCAQDFAAHRGVFVLIVGNDKASPATRLRALDLLGRYGAVLKLDLPEDREEAVNIAEDLPQELLDQIEKSLNR